MIIQDIQSDFNRTVQPRPHHAPTVPTPRPDATSPSPLPRPPRAGARGAGDAERDLGAHWERRAPWSERDGRAGRAASGLTGG